jgi:hypothetical protein
MTKPPPYQPKKITLVFLAIFALLLVIPLFPSIHRSDVLVCGFPDGSRFILTSDYDWYPTAKLFRSVAEEMNRSWWGIKYKDAKGHRSNPPAAVYYAGVDQNALRSGCAEAGGVRNKEAMVGLSYLQANGQWLPREGFPWEQMRIPSNAKDMLESKFGKAGFFDSPLRFGMILPLRDGRLVFEHPLSRSDSGYRYDKTFDGVYQSFSTDNGKTWSDPVITTDALIFQMGKRWIDQCFVARPIEFNGDKIAPDFPEPCPPNP